MQCLSDLYHMVFTCAFAFIGCQLVIQRNQLLFQVLVGTVLYLSLFSKRWFLQF